MAPAVVKKSKIEFSEEFVRATLSTEDYLASDDHGFKITFEDAWDAGRMTTQGFPKADEELDLLCKEHSYKAVKAAWKRRKR